MANRLGVYFGSFDPIHENHFAVALYALEKGHVSSVVIVANGDNPLKPEIAACTLRQQLIDARIEAEAASSHFGRRVFHYRCSKRELQRMGWAERCQLCKKLGKSRTFFPNMRDGEHPVGVDATVQLIGEDSLLQAFQNCNHSMNFARGRKLLVFPRTATKTPRLVHRVSCGSGSHPVTLDAVFESLRDPCAISQGTSGAEQQNPEQQLEIAIDFRDPIQDLSSTKIREAVGTAEQDGGQCPAGLHAAVHKKILELGMYRRQGPVMSGARNTADSAGKIPVVFFIGRPGCGKSANARELATEHGMRYFSSGDAFRKLFASRVRGGVEQDAKGKSRTHGKELGNGNLGGSNGGKCQQAQTISKKDATDHVLQEMERFLAECKRAGCAAVLDCQPRENADNARERDVLARQGLQINLLVNLVCSPEVAAERLAQRAARVGDKHVSSKQSAKGTSHENSSRRAEWGSEGEGGQNSSSRAEWGFEACVQQLISAGKQASPLCVADIDVNTSDRATVYGSIRERVREVLSIFWRKPSLNGHGHRTEADAETARDVPSLAPGFLPPGPDAGADLSSTEATSERGAKTDSASFAVLQHYDRAAQAYGGTKKSSRDESQKHFFYNNWIKSSLIALSARETVLAQKCATCSSSKQHLRPLCILDLGCGRGGDLGKWVEGIKLVQESLAQSGTGPRRSAVTEDVEFHYLGLDISPEAVDIARRRWAKIAVRSRRQLGSAEFRVADFTNFEGVRAQIVEWAWSWGAPDPRCFQIISSQMALHYSFESKEKAESFGKICRSFASRRTGAIFLGTTVDSDVVRARSVAGSAGSIAEEAEDGATFGCGNSLYSLRFVGKQEQAPSTPSVEERAGARATEREIFGNAYDFTLQGAIDNCREYAVDEPALQEFLTGGVEEAGDWPWFVGENFVSFGKRVMGLQEGPTSTAGRFFGDSFGALSPALRNLGAGPAYRLFDRVAQDFDLCTESREVVGLYRIALAWIDPASPGRTSGN